MIANLKIFAFFLCLFSSFHLSCNQRTVPPPPNGSPDFQDPIDDPISAPMDVVLGAERFDEYLSILQNKKVALLVNQTSMIGTTHLVDRLLSEGIEVVKIFAPEHGFRGDADAGEQVKDGRDTRTGLPVVSLYGSKKKPDATDLAGIDWVVFDIQDVGARFYTYISSMHYVMEACAENGLGFMVLDRPNPNGHYVDGPVLDLQFRSFVGMHQVPVVHGMTVGEYAQMINGEGWLKNGQRVELRVIPCLNYDHNQTYLLPVKPSPNLPNMRSIYLYPSLCFFEGTAVSVGRGTATQFQVLGHPDLTVGDYYFTPTPMPGAKYPKLLGKKCRGFDLTYLSEGDLKEVGQLEIQYLLDIYHHFPEKRAFFLKNKFIDKLAGSTQLREQIIAGMSAEEIRESWQYDLNEFKLMRKKYLLYKDF